MHRGARSASVVALVTNPAAVWLRPQPQGKRRSSWRRRRCQLTCARRNSTAKPLSRSLRLPCLSGSAPFVVHRVTLPPAAPIVPRRLGRTNHRWRYTRSRDAPFLESVAGGVALSALSRPVLSARHATSQVPAGANDQIVLGMIGVGLQGMSRLREFLKHPDTRIAAISDVDRLISIGLSPRSRRSADRSRSPSATSGACSKIAKSTQSSSSRPIIGTRFRRCGRSRRGRTCSSRSP